MNCSSRCPTCGSWDAIVIPSLPVALMFRRKRDVRIRTWQAMEFRFFVCKKCGQAFGYTDPTGPEISEYETPIKAQP